MKKLLSFGSALALSACLCGATTVTVGTPNYNNTAGNVLSPRFGTLINFDNLTSNAPVASGAEAAMGVQSMTSTNASDPLYAYPSSSQSAPNFLATQDTMGGLTFTFTNATSTVGVGILGGDGNPVTLALFGTTGNLIASFSEVVPIAGNTPDNAYYVLADPTADIKSFTVTSATGSFGLDDLQVATPEPMNLALVGGGALLLALTRLRKKASSQA